MSSTVAAPGLRGRVRAFVERPAFNHFVTAVIVINAVTLGLETWPKAMDVAGPALRFIDRTALWIFTIELTLKLFAYRLAFFDPTADFAGSSPDVEEQLRIDEMTHHTFGLTWNIPEVPVKLQANYTITIENKNRVFDNDRLELLGQLLF